MDLAKRHCVPCEGGIPPLDEAGIAALLPQVPAWQVRDGRLFRTFHLESFRAAMDFLNRVADLAEEEGHHPDFSVHYRRVDMEIWTHAVDGLTDNDFVLAARIDRLA